MPRAEQRCFGLDPGEAEIVDRALEEAADELGGPLRTEGGHPLPHEVTQARALVELASEYTGVDVEDVVGEVEAARADGGVVQVGEVGEPETVFKVRGQGGSADRPVHVDEECYILQQAEHDVQEVARVAVPDRRLCKNCRE